MSNLDIPNNAIQAYLAIDDDFDSNEAVIDAMRPIVAPVVAAELRRLADLWQAEADRLDVADRRVPGLATAAGRLTLRADELDPQT